jgi:hypothetical protein
MFRRSVLALVCVSAACGTVENDSSDANVPSQDGPAGDAPTDGPDSPEPDAGPGGPLTIGDARHDFQRVTIGASGQPFTTRVSNVSGAALGPLQVTITGDAAAEFAVSDDACDTRVLGAGSDCQLTVTFQPTQPGERVARLEISGGDDTVTMDLAGIGLTLGALAITPADGHGYGQVTIGQTSDSHTFMVTNTGESAIGRPTISVLDTVNFSIDDNTCVGELAPLGMCSVTASFKPSVGGVSTTSLLAASGQNMAAASLSGSGAGRVIVNKLGDGASVSAVVGGGVDCGTTCSANIDQSTVALVASVPTNTEITAWSIPACGTAERCVVPIDRASQTVDVTFRNRYLMSVARTGSGTGRVVATGGGIDCGTDCDELLFAQTNVTLQATADAGNVFAGWTGCTTTNGLTCSVTMGAAARPVSARFDRTHNLQVSVSGTGTLASDPAGISCGGDCSEAFAQGTVVTLTATPGNAQRVGSWGGACSSASGTTCTVTMDAAKTASVTFAARFTLTVRVGVDGASVNVSPAPSGGTTTCRSTAGCNYTYSAQTTVSLDANHPSPLTWVYDGWGGDCSSTDDFCTVVVSAPRSAVTRYHARQ